METSGRKTARSYEYEPPRNYMAPCVPTTLGLILSFLFPLPCHRVLEALSSSSQSSSSQCEPDVRPRPLRLGQSA